MSEKNDDSEERVKKALRNLPRVKAKPDFEQRLARKIAHPGRRGLQAAYFDFASRIPAPAYSAAAVLILATVSYYAFFRSGELPAPPATSPLTSNDISSASPPGKPAGPQKMDELSGAQKEDDLKRDKQNSPGERKEKGAALNERAKATSVDRQAKDAEAAQNHPPGESGLERGGTQERAQGVSMSGLKKVEKEGAVQESAQLPEALPQSAPANVAPGQKAIAPQSQVNSMKSSPYAVKAGTFNAPSDSVHIKDSLRADSLRKARVDSLKKK